MLVKNQSQGNEETWLLTHYILKLHSTPCLITTHLGRVVLIWSKPLLGLNFGGSFRHPHHGVVWHCEWIGSEWCRQGAFGARTKLLRCRRGSFISMWCDVFITIVWFAKTCKYSCLPILSTLHSAHSGNEKSQDDEQKRLRLLISFLRQLAACQSHLLYQARRYCLPTFYWSK